MAKQYYFIDFSLLTWRDLPVLLRQPAQHAWVKCLSEPVRLLWGKFNVNKTVNEYFLAHNSQVCYMEAALNDTFDTVPRRIYISDPVYYDPVVIYRRTEDKPVYLARRSELGSTAYTAPKPLYRRSEVYGGGGVQFIVNVPAALSFDEPRMRALIDSYRLAGMANYTIVTF